MINCRNCVNWVDEPLEEIEKDVEGQPHIFMGCRIYGYIENNTALEDCPHYRLTENLFTICSTCRRTVPKVCVSLGECVNCTDTDLFCVDHCLGGDSRKYCTHFIRLHTEGIHLIYQSQTFDLFPILGMPGSERPPSETGDSKPEPLTPPDEAKPLLPDWRSRRSKSRKG